MIRNRQQTINARVVEEVQNLAQLWSRWPKLGETSRVVVPSANFGQIPLRSLLGDVVLGVCQRHSFLEVDVTVL